MEFRFNEEQQAIADAAEPVFTDLCSDETIKDLNAGDKPLHTELWQQLAESGMHGLVIDEDYGGLGMTLVELCLILELQGRFVAPVPLIPTLVECAMPLGRSDNAALKEKVLPDVVSGELILSPVRPAGGYVVSDALRATQVGDGWTVNGVSGLVPYGGVADGFVVSAPTDDGDLVIFYCAADADGIAVTAQRTTSGELAGYVTFDTHTASSEQVLATGAAARDMAEKQKQDACIGLAALQVGVLSEGLKRTAEYVSQRKQFGRPLGAFQAVSQQAANAYMSIESLRGVYWRALDDIEHDKDAALSARVAKFWVGEAGHIAAHTILHLHGGIGQDIAYPVHRFFLWGKHNERYLGTPEEIAVDVGTLIAADAETVINVNTV
ncbi:MAG: acyl-CoA/acyl-ACP dehydrogenase [Gammaproteobacteria bacterium]|nr:acyl-CoA/acyl-ACP dehydrogenase [Gammaproteobacteria bacterium]